MTTKPSAQSRDKVLREAQLLRDRLRAEGRHRDAQIVTAVLRSAASSRGLNKVMSRDNAELRAKLGDA